jgi:hypothetical protein
MNSIIYLVGLVTPRQSGADRKRQYRADAKGRFHAGLTSNLDMADYRLRLLLSTRRWISAGELPTIGDGPAG